MSRTNRFGGLYGRVRKFPVIPIPPDEPLLGGLAEGDAELDPGHPCCEYLIEVLDSLDEMRLAGDHIRPFGDGYVDEPGLHGANLRFHPLWLIRFEHAPQPGSTPLWLPPAG